LRSLLLLEEGGVALYVSVGILPENSLLPLSIHSPKREGLGELIYSYRDPFLFRRFSILCRDLVRIRERMWLKFIFPVHLPFFDFLWMLLSSGGPSLLVRVNLLKERI
jgi:hypothetical protein